MLHELQSNGSTYWQQIFDWALTSAQSNEENQNLFKRQIETRLSDEDEAQVQKDIPRTIKWLAGSAGAPKLNDTERALRLEHLKQVLHAFLSTYERMRHLCHLRLQDLHHLVVFICKG
ncbi:hypothetical protein F444_10911 [Plasmopara halstedii]|uniref:Uncharacterized protein n=1 Tax=Plasmopara halstedii TaxID=4781 RepID=A0A0P1AHX2_PLAHL|nr:hypothetical protein F444_10911 [Plasmopara halstedii]CEG40836.1 hypothetical protein F444_10911 [Plasmopara halstedii]|eukprot:XP_024577205.1 hypothetical protein F444_10911 [Plasmopara halstedii]